MKQRVKRKIAEARAAVSSELERNIRIRDCTALYATHATIQCALKIGCTSCAYKICCFDVALDHEFCQAVPNQRPELCPRASSEAGAEGTLGYVAGMKILTVGDGDFSFSLALARLLSTKGNGLTVTSYESKATLARVYPTIEKTIVDLESMGAAVLFEVDATQLKKALPKGTLFDRIVWNFPCEGVSVQGNDGQNEQMDMNKELVRQFVADARYWLAEGGQIHMNHKTKPPFNQWKIEHVAVELSQSDNPVIQYVGRVVLDRFLFPPYVPRKALHHKSFPAHDACTYIFVRTSKDDKNVPQMEHLLSCSDYNLDLSPVEDAAALAAPVTPDLIKIIRSASLLSDASQELATHGRKKRRRR